MAETIRICTFLLEGRTFAVPVAEVREVVKDLETTPVPLAPPAVLGLAHLRGQIATAVDLRHRLGLTARRQGDQSVNVVVQGAEGLVCLSVDEVGDVIDVPQGVVERPPDTLRPAVREVVRGICKLEDELVLLLDTERAVDPSP
ncbi:MAG TPA: chemotaxis protein CheW [Anaeromyxobacteraceae bacterium]|nr:chemotaxis protein CheW [Anaeromyxobacteraceae bacterium]